MPRYVYRSTRPPGSFARFFGARVWLVASLVVLGVAGGALVGRYVASNTVVIGFGAAPLPAVEPPAEAAWTPAPRPVDQEAAAQVLPRVAPAPPSAAHAHRRSNVDPEKAEPFMFAVRPRLVDGATFTTVDGVTLKVDGVVGVAFGAVCNAPDGTRWACGARARAGLTQFLSERILICEPKGPRVGTTQVVECDVGGQDMSAWLVQRGFARIDTPPAR